jgi:NAD(P)-dependent dehydrogenase (short-subunit alcohol dehydrogenase family)
VSARVILTGAASGIGAGTMAALREQGARVVGLDLAEADDIIACDVSDQAAVDAAVAEAVERMGGVDVLVNNAGVGFAQSAGERPDERALKVVEVNLLGPWRVTAAALPALRASRGRVVNVASGLSILTVPFATAYCMSKRGLVAYSDALRAEFGDEITVTTVYPGYIRTPIHDAAADDGIGLQGMVPEEPLENAVATLVRATLGPPRRDLATTRRGTLSYALLSRLPRGAIDRGMRRHLQRMARRGNFTEGIAATFGARLRGEPERPATDG